MPSGNVPAPNGKTWNQIKIRARISATIGTVILVLLAGGAAAGYYFAQSRNQPVAKKPVVETLSAEELRKLSEVGTSLGSSGQTLNIGANVLMRGKVDVGGDLSIGGRLNANNAATLSQVNITGATAATSINASSNLTVGGVTSLQRSLTVQDLATFNGGINVAGSASFNSLNASSIAVRTISISGPLTIGHLTTQGPAPSIAAGTAAGSGGTVNISGNDTAGTVNINTGSTPPAGILATVNFRAAYTASIRVLLSPASGPAAQTSAYVTRNAAGFQIRTDTPPPAGSVLSFDYFVTQ